MTGLDPDSNLIVSGNLPPEYAALILGCDRALRNLHFVEVYEDPHTCCPRCCSTCQPLREAYELKLELEEWLRVPDHWWFMNPFPVARLDGQGHWTTVGRRISWSLITQRWQDHKDAFDCAVARRDSRLAWEALEGTA